MTTTYASIPHVPGAPSPTQPEWKPAGFHVPTKQGVVCTLCPHRCVLRHDGDVGYCQVRRRNGTGMETATYATSVRHVDAVERKPLYHFRPGARVLTLASPGCSWRCDYCQNHRLSQYGRSDEAPWSARPISAQEVVDAAHGLGVGVVGLSYSEPSLAAELTLSVAELAEPAGLDMVWKTNGYLTRDAAKCLAPALSAANVDLKAVDVAAHRRLTGADVQPVLDTIATWVDAGVWVEVSTPLIPGYHDEPALRAVAQAVAKIGRWIPWHVQRFVPEFRLAAALPTPRSLVDAALRAAQAAGLQHVYSERLLAEHGRSTRCPTCGIIVVARGIWSLTRNELAEGACPACNTPIAGVWNPCKGA